MIKSTKILKKPSSDLYKSKLKMKTNEKLEQQQLNSSSSADNGDLQQQQLQHAPLKTFSLKGNHLSGSILIGNYNVRVLRTLKNNKYYNLETEKSL